MWSQSGRYGITYNGEIYNYQELRKQLPSSINWKSNCDTEVILEACEHWGVEATAKRLNGMFAFALWSTETKRLTLVRDRLGIKPLYYYQDGKQFGFASELRSLSALPKFDRSLSPTAIRSLIARGHVAAPNSIFKKVRKLEPGTILELSQPHQQPQIRKFWSCADAVKNGLENPYLGDDAVHILQELLLESVQRRMISDVPLGAFLSGGIDSSLVVSLMQQLSSRPVKTFSIGFEEPRFDESPFARAVANHLGTDHTEMIVRAKDALDLLPELGSYEPFADQSLFPTMLVSKLAKTEVTVSLSGDGGDELFGGYTRYFRTLKYWKRLGPVNRLLNGVGVNWWIEKRRRGWRAPERILGRKRATRFDRFFTYAAAANLGEFYQVQIDGGCIGVIEPEFLSGDYFSHPFSELAKPAHSEQLLQLMLIDSVSYLPNDILTKVDRASMRYSLEARVPLLDHNILEFAFRLNDSHRRVNGAGKRILKDVLNQYVPRELFDRKKKGFGVPIAQWIRTDLRDWSEELLSEKALAQSGFFDVASIRNMWSEHLQGSNSWYWQIWRVLVFQNWHAEFFKTVV